MLQVIKHFRWVSLIVWIAICGKSFVQAAAACDGRPEVAENLHLLSPAERAFNLRIQEFLELSRSSPRLADNTFVSNAAWNSLMELAEKANAYYSGQASRTENPILRRAYLNLSRSFPETVRRIGVRSHHRSQK